MRSSIKICKTSEKKRSKQKSWGKNPFVQTKNTVEGHFSKIEQVEDRISELKNKKAAIKEKKQNKS
jgi:hypothetical protein